MNFFITKFFESVLQTKIKNGKKIKYNKLKNLILKNLKLNFLKKKKNIYSIFFKNKIEFHNLKKLNSILFLKKKSKKNLIFLKKNIKFLKFITFKNIKKIYKNKFNILFVNSKFSNNFRKNVKKSFNNILFNYEKWKHFNLIFSKVLKNFKLKKMEYNFFNLKFNVKNLNLNRFYFQFNFIEKSFYDKNFKSNFFFEKILNKFFFPFMSRKIYLKTPSGHKKEIIKFFFNSKRNIFFPLLNFLKNFNNTQKQKNKYLKNIGYNKKISYFEKNGQLFFNNLKNNYKNCDILNINNLVLNSLKKLNNKNELETFYLNDHKNKLFFFNKYKFQILKTIKIQKKKKNLKTIKKGKKTKPFPWILKK